MRLTSAVEIPFLNQMVIEEFSSLKVLSSSGELVKMNPIVLAAMNSTLVSSLTQHDIEDYCIITEFTKPELESVKEFAWTGKCRQSLSAVFKALGIDLFYMFDHKMELEVTPSVKAEESSYLDEFVDYFDDYNDLIPEAVRNHQSETTTPKKKKGRPRKVLLDDDDDSDEDYTIKPKKRKTIKSEADNEQENELTLTALTSEQQVLFAEFVLAKPVEEYKHFPLEPKVFNSSEDTKNVHKPLACHLCPSRFTSDYGLQLHLIKFHSEHYSCDSCYQIFAVTDVDKFKLHMFKHDQNMLVGTSTCVECGITFKRTNKYNEHIKLKGPFHDDQCAQCPDKFASFEEYQVHVQDKHDNIMKFKCGFCKEVFNDKSELLRHTKSLHAALKPKLNKGKKSPKPQIPKKKTVCVECGTMISNLKHHMSTVHSNQTIPCPHCELTFKALPLLQRHIDWIHVKAPCTECGEMVGIRKMPRHMKQKHTSIYDRKYKCETCGKGFSTSAALRDHINVHTGAKPHKCKYCSAAFASVGTHAMHQRSHLGHRRSK